MNHLFFLLVHKNMQSRQMIPETISKPGIFVFSFPEMFELCVCLGVCSLFAVVFPVLGLVCVLFTAGLTSLLASCIQVTLSVVFPVIVKGEKPGVWAVKYRSFSSSPDKVVGSLFHLLSLYLFRIMEDLLILLSFIQDFSTLKYMTAFSILFELQTHCFQPRY